MNAVNDCTITLPRWTVGEDALSGLPEAARGYGRRAVLVGGEKALAAMEADIRAACAGRIELTGTLRYGGEASEENVARLMAEEAVRRADIVFAVGGGKALDTGKTLGYRLDRPVFTFPTIASTCAATTAVAILYHPDGSFAAPCFLPAPPAHAFIRLPVIAKAPSRYLWAGLGDTYAKCVEAEISARGDELTHCHDLGVGVSRKCLEPLLRYGAQALRDNKAGLVTPALRETVLAVIVNTGVASILLTEGRIIDYNTGLAHAIFYALTAFPELGVEKAHLHGEVVGFGVLAALLVDGQEALFTQLHRFNRAVGLPTRLGDIGVRYADLDRVIPKVLSMPDIAHYPYRVTEDALRRAFDRLETTA